MTKPADPAGHAVPYAETDVIVAGGGPVGLTLAHELGSRGVAAVLVEPRRATDPSPPRCKQVNPRSMEHFRRLGPAGAVRASSALRGGPPSPGASGRTRA